MPRRARFQEPGAWHHVHAKVARRAREFPLAEAACKRELVRLLQHYSRIYCCEVAAYCVMGNHWHGVVRFELPRTMESTELFERAMAMYPNSRKQLQAWTDAQWERFHDRLFSLSEFMRNVQSSFARWYNQTYDREGRFWADRFKNTVLADEDALLDCMLYVDLNPVRAGLVQHPEAYEASSAWSRAAKRAGWLLPLQDLLGTPGAKEAWQAYRQRLYHRGSVPTKEGQAGISETVLEAEAARGFAARGAFRKRLRYFTDGLLIGTEVAVRQHLTALRRRGEYQRRRHPITQPDGATFSLREQRSHAVHLEKSP
jgi:putative transposase